MQTRPVPPCRRPCAGESPDRRRRALARAALSSLVVAGLGHGGPARAQAAASVRIVVPFVPGGANDAFARQMAPGLAELRGVPVVVENRGGAGGTIGTEQVVRAATGPADPLTLLLAHTGTVSINPSLYKQLRFDPRTDLQPVAMFASSALVLVVPAASPVKSVAELVAYARSQPNGLVYGSSGTGTGSHLSGELLEQKMRLKLTHVPYKGTGPALTDLAGGQLQMMFCVIPPALALVKAGRLRAVAVTSPRRLPSLPDVPTVIESGIAELSGFDSTLTYGLLAPVSVAQTVVRELSSQVLQVARRPEFQARLEIDGAVPLLGGPAEYGERIRRESAQWAEIIRISGATAE